MLIPRFCVFFCMKKDFKPDSMFVKETVLFRPSDERAHNIHCKNFINNVRLKAKQLRKTVCTVEKNCARFANSTVEIFKNIQPPNPNDVMIFTVLVLSLALNFSPPPPPSLDG